MKFRWLLLSSETGSPGGTGNPIETGKRMRCSFQSKTFKVELTYAAKIPLRSIGLALKGADQENTSQDALRVLDIILRQQAADRYLFLFLFCTSFLCNVFNEFS